jgi:hexosaminidase
MAIRGVHFGIPPREEIPFIKRLIRHLLAPMRMNTIFLQVTAGMKFDRRPEINEAWERANRKAAMRKAPPVPHGDMVCGGSYLTKEEIRDLVEYAREYGFEVIPEVQSLSHVQYLTITYSEIAEEKGRPQ